jgi:hypothetical protein
MKRKVLTRRTFMDAAFSPRTWHTIIREDSSASRYVRLFLQARARDPFTRADLTFVPRRTVDRHLARWKEGHLLESAGRVRQKLPFNPRARKVAKDRIRVDRRGQRRGRPVELYRMGDPLPRRPGFHQAQLRAAIALMRRPDGPQLLAAPMKRGLEILIDPEGRKFLEEWVIPLFPESVRPTIHGLLDVFEHADPAFLTALPDRMEAEIVSTCETTFPQLAAALEMIAEREGSPQVGQAPSRLLPLS